MIFRFLVLGLILSGFTGPARAQAANDPAVPSATAPAEDTNSSPYHQALLSYKSGHYDQARTAIDAAEQAQPNDLPTKILKARILIALLDFAPAKAELESVTGKPGLTPEIQYAQTLAFGDLNLRKRSFDQAAKFYAALLAQKPGDPDLILKLVYTRIGASDLPDAAKYASQLKPLDPDHPSYYFAHAAIARATGQTQEAEDDIQTARTIYGIFQTTRYLKAYLEFFESSDKNPSDDLIPPPRLKPGPGDAKP